MIKSDTYHDTWTNYLMEQEPSLIQDRADGDGCCCCLLNLHAAARAILLEDG
jgi:hypothetical protein